VTKVGGAVLRPQGILQHIQPKYNDIVVDCGAPTGGGKCELFLKGNFKGIKKELIKNELPYKFLVPSNLLILIGED